MFFVTGSGCVYAEVARRQSVAAGRAAHAEIGTVEKTVRNLDRAVRTTGPIDDQPPAAPAVPLPSHEIPAHSDGSNHSSGAWQPASGTAPAMAAQLNDPTGHAVGVRFA